MRPVLPTACDYQEHEFALWLENTEPGNHDVHQSLIERYAPEIFNLARGFLSKYRSIPVREEDLLLVVQRTFDLAIEDLPSFQGQESVRSWLFRATIQAIRKTRLQLACQNMKRFWRHSSHEVSKQELHQSLDSNLERLWEGVQTLEEKSRIIAFLRYVHRLTLPEIACALEEEEIRIHEWLVRIRNELLDVQLADVEKISSHGDFQLRIQAFMDWGHDEFISQNLLSTNTQLSAHLDNCVSCRNYLNRLSELEVRLTQALSLGRLTPVMSRDSIRGVLPLHTTRLKIPPHLEMQLNKAMTISKELAWLGSVLLIVFSLAWYFTKQDTEDEKSPLQVALDTIPTPIPASAEVMRTAPRPNMTLSGLTESIQIMNPVLSADGHTVAYELLTRKLVNGLLETSSQVKVYYLDSRRIETVSPPIGDTPENEMSLHPSISADGRWVAFMSTSSNLADGNYHRCIWDNEETNCFDIFIKNLLTGEIKRIDTTSKNHEAVSHRVLPALSPDGLWVVFWSYTIDHMPESDSGCIPLDQSLACWDIYIFDLRNEETIRVPIGRSGKPSEWPSDDFLSVSGDGRWLTLTLLAGDAIAEELNLENNREVYLYDRILKTFETVNLSTNGAPGDGDSYNSSLTPDGRFIVFTSEADNLVHGDHNQSADVFLRDRLKSSTERISVSGDGHEGNDSSGVFPEDFVSWGTRNTLSADGRFVTFFSTSDNLGENSSTSCRSGVWFPCSLIYVRDRQLEITKSVIKEQPLNAFYVYPHISSDGRWISLVHLDLECPRKPICSVLLLNDQQTRQTTQFMNPIKVGSSANEQLLDNSTYLESPNGRVNHLDFSPDGKLLAAGDDDGSISVWNVKDNNLVYRLEDHNLPVSSVAFSPDGKLLATGSYDGKVFINRAEDGAQLYYLTGNGRPIVSLTFSPDGENLSVGASGGAWNLEAAEKTFSTLAYYEYPGNQVNQIVFSPDGRLTAHALSDTTVWLRRTSDGEVLARLSGSGSKVLSVTFSPDGNYLASGSAEGRVDLWKIEAQDESTWSYNNVLTLMHTSWVGDLDFSPDGKVLAVASLGSSVCLWRIPSGELISTSLGTTWDSALSLEYTPDGKSLAVSLSWGGVKIYALPLLQ